MDHPTADLVRVSALAPGDLVTETTSPAGPWYRVVDADPAAGLLVIDAGDGLRVDVPTGDPDSVVLRRRP